MEIVDESALKRPRRSGRSSRGTSRDAAPPPPPSIHPFPVEGLPAIDGSSILARELADMIEQNDKNCLARIDFVDVEDAVIEKIFVNQWHHNRGEVIYPPRSLRRTVRQIRDWFNMGTNQKKAHLEHCSGVDVVVNHRPYDEETAWNGNAWVDMLPSTVESESDSSDEDILPEPSPPKFCEGVTLEHIRGSRVSEERKRILEVGFKHTVREGMTSRVRLSHPDDDRWSFCPPVIGSVMDGNQPDIVQWVVKEQDHPGGDQFSHIGIFHRDCTGEQLEGGHSLCTHCRRKKQDLVTRFDSNVTVRSTEFHPKMRNSITQRTGSLQAQRTDYHRRQSKNKTMAILRRGRLIERMERDQVEVLENKHSRSLFNPDMQAAVNEFLDANVSKDSAAKYAYARAVHNQQVAREKGASAVRHCPVIIRLAAVVKRSMKKTGLYELVAKIAGWPSRQTIRSFLG